MGYLAYILNSDQRQSLLEQFQPAYSEIRAHHVTIQLKQPDSGTMPKAETIDIIGIADDGNGIQALIVEVNGNKYRNDGRIYHATWSFEPTKDAPAAYDINRPVEKRKARPYRAFHSNGMILNAISERNDHIKWLDRPICLGPHKSTFVEKKIDPMGAVSKPKSTPNKTR